MRYLDGPLLPIYLLKAENIPWVKVTFVVIASDGFGSMPSTSYAPSATFGSSSYFGSNCKRHIDIVNDFSHIKKFDSV